MFATLSILFALSVVFNIMQAKEIEKLKSQLDK